MGVREGNVTLETEVRECGRDVKMLRTGSEDGERGHEPKNAGRRSPDAGRWLV